MAKTERYETIIRLNTEQAKKEIDVLEKKIADLRKKQSSYAPDSKQFKNLEKEIKKNEKQLEMMQNRLTAVNKAIRNMSDASPRQLRNTIKDINELLNSGNIKRGGEDWKALTAALKEANTELARIKNESKASQPALSKFFKFLNDSWGGIFVLVQSISGISTTIRKSVEDYATMEEEMADVRKYTGMTADQVRDLNEELKRMDTRTSREQLNQLAGSAGRLGLQSKKDIMEFVEAADMIGVALGDDLGDGAVDKIGKLAMAFGEDDRKGLKGAMLSTGSALNELAQNSSAQAGYLVDYTARVAGFGKQLGLTQAQIMGFGAVMDENLLRDEMAATAFGNMLTKMQTDTEKFAKIAGKDVKEFSDLLRKDANAAILTLADSLKAADPQNMMKMLDDMGLDGSRAVGVLSTLADKIDDVRKHQARATEAYEKATSVQGEFNTMNTTVQARLDKCKKQFKEMSVELGERLLPLVKYTITGASMLAKTLSVLTGFVYEHWKSLTVLGGYIVILTAIWNANTIAMKVSNAVETISVAIKKGHAFVVNTLQQAYVAWRIIIAAVTANHVRLNSAMVDMKRLQMTNVWTALITVVLTAAVAIYGVYKAWNKHSEAVRNSLQQVKEMRAQQELEKDLNKKVSESIAEQKTKVEQLSRIIHSNAYTIDERRSAIKRLQSIIPDYHASITNEGKLYNDNSAAIKQYIQDLSDAALAEAVYQKKVEINRKKMELSFKQHRIENSLKAVQAYRDTQQQVTEEMVYENGSVVKKQHKTKSAEESDRQQKRHEQRLADVKSETKVVEAEEKYIDQVLEKNKKANELLTKKITSPVATPATPGPTTPSGDYVSDADRKKREQEQRKAEADRRKKEAEDRKALQEQSKQLKAEMDNRLAEEALNYSAGLTNYLEYIEKRRQIQLDGIRQRKALFEEGSTEYLRLDAEEKKLLILGDEEQRKMTLKEYEQMHRDLLLELERDFNTEGSAIYQNEEALREARFQEEMDFLENKKSLTRKGSLEQMQTEWEIQDRSKEHQIEREREYMNRLSQYRQEMGQTDYDRLQEIELAGVQSFYRALVDQGKMTQQEYDAIIEHIKRKYAGLKGEQKANSDVQSKASSALDTARKNAGIKDYGAGSDAATGVFSISQAVQNQKTVNEQLKLLYGQDYENNKEYQEAKRQLDQQTMQDIVAGAQAAYSSISTLMSAASSYAQACSDLEVAKITANYDKQIEAAGKNSRKKEKLEKEKDKKIADAKTKANKKAMAIEIAQAIAQTAMGAISAYSSTMAGAPYPANLVLAPISAGIALAAGALQIATIKKQHQAEEAGYYEGGFTGGRRYRKEAGVVHEGEFVANHQAVNNPNVLPFLNFLDQAQRNNTVGSLTVQDVSRSMGAGGTTQMITPIVNVQTDNGELRSELEDLNETNRGLRECLESGIGILFPMDDFDKNYRHYRKLKERG